MSLDIDTGLSERKHHISFKKEDHYCYN